MYKNKSGGFDVMSDEFKSSANVNEEGTIDFVKPAGCVSADYSKIELCIMADVTSEQLQFGAKEWGTDINGSKF